MDVLSASADRPLRAATSKDEDYMNTKIPPANGYTQEQAVCRLIQPTTSLNKSFIKALLSHTAPHNAVTLKWYNIMTFHPCINSASCCNVHADHEWRDRCCSNGLQQRVSVSLSGPRSGCSCRITAPSGLETRSCLIFTVCLVPTSEEELWVKCSHSSMSYEKDTTKVVCVFIVILNIFGPLTHFQVPTRLIPLLGWFFWSQECRGNKLLSKLDVLAL